jgi:3-phytase
MRAQEPIVIKAIAKTDDVETEGDAADDSCTYVHKDDPAQSLIIGTDKKSGLIVYNLSGKRQQRFLDGHQNNVDIRYEFDFDDDDIALISAGNRTTNTIDFYAVDDKNMVKRLAVGVHDAGLKIYGSCMYRSPKSKKMYVFVTSKNGAVIQWEVSEKKKKLLLKSVRRFNVGTQAEGCVVDDDLRYFYVSEEKVGIWRYGADPKDGDSRQQIDRTGDGGHLVADVEGLTIYRIKDDDGYLLASSQGESAFNVYRRKSGDFLGKFRVVYDGKPIENTDGVDVTSHRLSEVFPNGLLVVQDGNRENARQSFKLVSWTELATSFSTPLKLSEKDPLVD